MNKNETIEQTLSDMKDRIVEMPSGTKYMINNDGSWVNVEKQRKRLQKKMDEFRKAIVKKNR